MNLMLRLIQEAIDMKLMIQWAFTSSALILIVLAVRRLFRDKLSARLKYALWGVVLLRLLIPFQVELPAPVSDSLPVLATNLAQDVTPRLDDTMLYAIPTEEQPYGLPAGLPPQYARNGLYGDLEYYSGGVVYDGEHITRYAFMLTALEVVVLIWIAGTALAALVILTSNLHFARRLRKRREPLDIPDAPVPVYVAEGLPSPCLFGVLRPAVYVTPQAAENPDTLRHVLAHELTHYAHLDHLWSLLRCFSLALHWYNPLVWLAVGLSKQDGELACDEGAVARLGEAERIPYGRTLVDMVAARGPRPADLLSCSTAMTGGEKSIKKRVTQIVKKPETVKIALFAAVALVALAVVFVFAGRSEGGKDGNYHTFLSDVKNAQSIHLGREMISSYRGPAITDPELLSQAKEILRKGAADWLNPPRVLEDLDLSSQRTLTLTDPQGQEVRYLLIGRASDQHQQTDLYVITDGSLSRVRGSRVAVCLEQDAVYQLDALTRQQGREDNTLITPGSSPELEEFFAQLESAQSIFVDQLSLSSASPPGLISDPEALARAKELLGKARGPLQLAEGVTREEFWESIRPFLSSTEYQDMEEPPTITQEELENMLFMRGNPILLCPGTEVTPDAEYRYWLADHMLLLWDEELEENPKALATFSDDVYSQLAELARSEEPERVHPVTGPKEQPSPNPGNPATGAASSEQISPDPEPERVHPVTGAEEPASLYVTPNEGERVHPVTGTGKSDTDDGKDEWEKQQTAEYQAAGVTMDGKSYYYQGQLVNIFLDIRANQSFYTLDTNPAGAVNVKIIRDKDDQISGVAYMSDEEAAELLADLRDD